MQYGLALPGAAQIIRQTVFHLDLSPLPHHAQLWSGPVGAAHLAAALAGHRADGLPGVLWAVAGMRAHLHRYICQIHALLHHWPAPAVDMQIGAKVVAGGRLELPAPQELPGPDTASFAGLDAYCQLIRWEAC